MVGDVLSFAFWERILGAMTVFLDFFLGGGGIWSVFDAYSSVRLLSFT